MAISSMDQLIASITAGKAYRSDFNKNYLPVGTGAVGIWYDLSIGAGNPMMVPAAVDLGIELSLLANSSTDSAAQIAPYVVLDLSNEAAVLTWAKKCDVVTFEHEQVPAKTIEAIEKAGVKVFPRASSFIFSQNKLLMRQKISELKLPNPQWSSYDGGISPITFPLIAKTPTGGYDGRGVFVGWR